MLLVRLLEQAIPEEANSLVATTLGHKRYKYAISDTFRVRTVAIQQYDIIKPAILVIDPYWAKIRFGLSTRMKEIPDNDDIRC